ncbi:MAG: winged helix-turn-helix domain-containing protein [Bacilli bacterium]|jgi:DNA-binding winged helix-turn-helix (wHTH) protein|nr:winged helix-turn-helix domain-containing protein [Bacilli bacterium]
MEKRNIVVFIEDNFYAKYVACKLIEYKKIYEIYYDFNNFEKNISNNKYHTIIFDSTNNKEQNIVRINIILKYQNDARIIIIDENNYYNYPSNNHLFVIKDKLQLDSILTDLHNDYPIHMSNFVFNKKYQLLLDIENKLAIFHNKKLILSLSQFIILKKLVSNPNTIFSIKDLYYELYPKEYNNDNISYYSITSIIKILRRKINFDCIKTIRGKGYMWN